MTDKQESAFNKYLEGENIFITGQGGTGKSYFIKKIYDDSIKNGKNINVTALTGCAALLLDCKATTIHHWSGIGMGNLNVDDSIYQINKYKKRKNWVNCDILIIDEISMLSGEIFELLDNIGKKIRKNKKPFGGIQLIFSGDFHQLPPVCYNKFCFETQLWSECFKYELLFTKNYRQNDDEDYKNILTEIRNESLSDKSKDLLLQCINKKKPDDIEPTILVPVKKLSDKINQEKNNNIKGKSKTYTFSYIKKCSKNIELELLKQKKSIIIEDVLDLKIGSQVMCIINLDQENGIINGSQGKVINFNDKDEPIVKFFYNNIIKTISVNNWLNDKFNDNGIKQIPLILSWSITIHKSQGITLEYANINIGQNVFECGQSYVALSRVKSLDGLYIKDIDFNKIRSNKKVINYYSKFN